MKHSDFSKQTHTNAGTFPLAHLRAEFDKQRFDVGPVDVGGSGSGKYPFECFLVFAFHSDIVPHLSTVSRMKY